MKITPYLSFPGKCAEAFALYEKVLHGKIMFSMTYGEAPGGEQVPAEQRQNIMHISLQVGDNLIQGADAPGQYYTIPGGFSIAIATKDYAEAEGIFKSLSDGGQVRMPLQKTFWSPGFAMFIDKYTIPWMLNVEQSM